MKITVHSREWDPKMKTAFALRVEPEAQKLFILAPKYDWPAQLLCLMVDNKNFEDRHFADLQNGQHTPRLEH
jgi:hypothetical protein